MAKGMWDRLSESVRDSPVSDGERDRYTEYSERVPKPMQWKEWLGYDRGYRSGEFKPSSGSSREKIKILGIDLDTPVENSQEYEARTLAESDFTIPDEIQAEIGKLSEQDYSEDPAVDAALAAGRAARGNQIRSIEDLNKILLGRQTSAEMRGSISGQRLAREMAGTLDRPGMLGRSQEAWTGLADQTMQAALQERGGQRQALNAAVDNFRRGETADLRLSQARDKARLQSEVDREQLIGNYVGIAVDERKRRQQEALQRAGNQTRLDVAAMGMPETTDYQYGKRAVLGGLNAAGTAISMGSEIFGGRDTPEPIDVDPVTQYVRESTAGSSKWGV